MAQELIMALAVCAVLAGARSFTAIAEWAADTDERSALESHSALPVTVIGIHELDPVGSSHDSTGTWTR